MTTSFGNFALPLASRRFERFELRLRSSFDLIAPAGHSPSRSSRAHERMKNTTSTTSKLPCTSRLPPSPPATPPSHERSLSIPALPPKLYFHILSFLPAGCWISIKTLLNASLVSRAFKVAASIPSLWAPHLDRCFPRNPAHWVLLPTTCDAEDQEFLDELFGSNNGRKLSGKEGFKIRWLLRSFAEAHLRRLIADPVGKLRSFDVLCGLAPMVWGDISKLAPENWVMGAEFEGTELTRQYWVHEVAASMERREAARIWRGIDHGTVCRGFWDRMEWGTACFAAFAGGSIGDVSLRAGYTLADHSLTFLQAYQTFWRLFCSIEDDVTHQIPNPDQEVDSLPSSAPALLVRAQLLQSTEDLFKEILQHLAKNQLEPLAPKATVSERYSELDGVRRQNCRDFEALQADPPSL